MKLDGGNFRIGIVIGESQSFSPGSRTTVENMRAVADKGCDELRGFVLNHTKTRSKSSSPGDVSVLNSARRVKEHTRSKLDSFGAERLFCFRMTKTDRGHGNRLVVLANAKSGIDSVGLDPAFDEPEWVSAAGSESLG
jgi:hypothetical protein